VADFSEYGNEPPGLKKKAGNFLIVSATINFLSRTLFSWTL
jgi:hypothetical protein